MTRASSSCIHSSDLVRGAHVRRDVRSPSAGLLRVWGQGGARPGVLLPRPGGLSARTAERHHNLTGEELAVGACAPSEELFVGACAPSAEPLCACMVFEERNHNLQAPCSCIHKWLTRRLGVTLQAAVEERRGLRVEGRGEGAFEFGKKAGGASEGRGEEGSVECAGAMSLLEVLEHTHETRNLLITLASICRCSVESDEERGNRGSIWECAPVKGHELLDGLHGLVERGGESSMSVLSGLLKRSIAPLLSVTSSCIFTAQVMHYSSMVGYRLSHVCSPGHVQTSL